MYKANTLYLISLHFQPINLNPQNSRTMADSHSERPVAFDVEFGQCTKPMPDRLKKRASVQTKPVTREDIEEKQRQADMRRQVKNNFFFFFFDYRGHYPRRDYDPIFETQTEIYYSHEPNEYTL